MKNPDMKDSRLIGVLGAAVPILINNSTNTALIVRSV